MGTLVQADVGIDTAMAVLQDRRRDVVDAARERGVKAGSLRLRMFRPFPEGVLRGYLEGRQRVGILDRDISLGHGGVLWSEIRGVIPSETVVQNYIVGLGGGDIRPQHIEDMLTDLMKREGADLPEIVEVGS